MIYDYLMENYKQGEPIFSADIHIHEMSEENIRYHLKKLTDDGVICRFESGIYYLPKRNILGAKNFMKEMSLHLTERVFRSANDYKITGIKEFSQL